VTPVLRPRIETLRFRSEQRELAFPSVHPSHPGVFPEDTTGLRAAAPAESTIADMEDIEVRLNKYTSIARQTLPRLALAGIVSALLAGCGSGTMNSSNFTGTVGSGPIVGVAPGDGTSGGTSAQCTSTGLAAVDLSGQCRATPQATMGALEASSGAIATARATVSGASQQLIVAWQPAPDPVAGYVIYYGPTPDAANALLSDLSAGSYNPAAPSVSYDPMRDLGVSSGDQVCFRIFPYDSVRTLSDTPQLFCTTA
jgi:hypothetical protein